MWWKFKFHVFYYKLGRWKVCFFTPKQSNLYKQETVKHCCFCCRFNVQFLVWVFSGTLIVDCAVSSHKVMANNCVELAGHIENGIFYESRNGHMKFSLQHHPCIYKAFTLTTNSCLLNFFVVTVYHKVGKSNITSFKWTLHWSK